MENTLENYYELHVNNNELTFKCVGQFNIYQEYLENVFNNYTLDQELNIKYIFNETELIDLKNNIIYKLNNSFQSHGNLFYHGFRTNGQLTELGFYSNETEFLNEYYDEGYNSFSMSSDGVFYGEDDKLNQIVELINKTLEINNISNDEILSYFNDNTNIELNKDN